MLSRGGSESKYRAGAGTIGANAGTNLIEKYSFVVWLFKSLFQHRNRTRCITEEQENQPQKCLGEFEYIGDPIEYLAQMKEQN